MLLGLTISNVAVFEDISVDFRNNFNVITGETGSGKSILIEALKLLAGNRANKKLIRKGAESAYVSGTFDIKDEKIFKILRKYDIIIDDSDYIIISREIFENGKSKNKINSRNVTISLLNEISFFLFDIYGQFDSGKLYQKEKHKQLLDTVCDSKIDILKKNYRSLYRDYREKTVRKLELEKNLISRDARLDQYKYEIEEIENADLRIDEEDELIKELKKLSNAKDIKNEIAECNSLLNDDENSALSNLNRALGVLSKLKEYDDKIEIISDRLDISISEIQDISISLAGYFEDLDIDDENIELIDERLSFINRLKRKYGYTIEDIEKYLEELKNDYSELINVSDSLEQLNEEIKVSVDKMYELTDEISDYRKIGKDFLEKNMPLELKKLNMQNINFKVNFVNRENFNENGLQDVEFLISTNIGSDLGELDKIVSGGEASRIMLALKKLSNQDVSSSTMILDEIDTGISGKTASMAGEVIEELSKKSQILCITHSPQIAAITKDHYLIEKTTKNNETISKIYKLDDDSRIMEVARLLSGINITKKSISNARQLISESAL